MKLYGLVLGCLCILLFLLVLIRTIRLWRIIGWRYRSGELLEMFGALLAALELLSGNLHAFWGFFVLIVGWMVVNPEELTRPVKLFRNRREQSDSEK